MVHVISPSTAFSWINIFVDPGTTFQSTNQIWETSLQFVYKFRLPARVSCVYISVIHNFPLVLVMVRDRIKTTFLDKDVVTGTTKYVDPW